MKLDRFFRLHHCTYPPSEGVAMLRNHSGCEYLGLKRDERPTCRENGIAKNINDDSNPGNANS